ncbi:MAG: hypothetical protein MK214_10735 [Thalassotalea sp.]|nr:hypothetical protein [Thalassotalea sp.]
MKIDQNITIADLRGSKFYQAQESSDLKVTPLRNKESQYPSNKVYKTFPSNDSSNSKVFKGDTKIILPESNEISIKMEKVFNRLGKEEQNFLIDSGYIANNAFLKLAEKLEDDDLKKLTVVIKALDNKLINHFNNDTILKTEKLFDVLNNSSDKDIKTVLHTSSKLYSQEVTDINVPIYSHGGIIDRSTNIESLHGFISQLISSEDSSIFLEEMDNYDFYQQEKIYNVFFFDSELGNRLMRELDNRDSEARDAMLGFVSEIATTSKFSNFKDRVTLGSNLSVMPGIDNYFKNVSSSLIEDAISLIENFAFNDNQLADMGNALMNLDRAGQRAYMEITKAGLAVRVDPEANAAEIQEALDDIDVARENESVRADVFLARYGQKVDGEVVRYEYKMISQANEDMKEAAFRLFE